MTKLRMLFGASGLLAALLIGTLVAPATSQVEPQRVTLTFFDPRPTEHAKSIDEKPKGFSPGDWEVAREKQLDPETCEAAGQLILQFTFVEQTGKEDGWARFNGDFVLDDGKISFQSAGKFSDFESEAGFTFSITGGTGAYKDATGQGSVSEGGTLCDKKGDTVTLDLLLQH